MIYGMKKLLCSYVVVELVFVGVGNLLHSRVDSCMYYVYLHVHQYHGGFQCSTTMVINLGSCSISAAFELSIWPIHRVIGDKL